MAGRVNTKFVFILSAVVVVLVGGIVLVAQLANRDAQDLMAESDRYLAEGEYKLAAESMRRAAFRSKSDPAVIQRYIEVVQQVPAADKVEADNTMNIARQFSLNLVQIDPNSEEYLKDYCDLIERFIERIRTGGGMHPFSHYIYQAADERLAARPDDKLARRYRGIYGLPQLNAEMSDEDINQVRDDLLWAQAEYPDDPEVAISVARWKLFDADRLDRPGGDADMAKTLRQEAQAISEKLVEDDPDDINRKVDHLQIILQANRGELDKDDPYSIIKPLLNEIEQDLLEDPAPFKAVSTTLAYLKTVYAKPLEVDENGEKADVNLSEGIERALALLTRATEKYPDDARYSLLLGIELKQVSRYQQSRPYIEKVKDLKTQGDYLDVILNDTLKRLAQIEYADLLISLGQLADDQQQTDAMYAEAGKILDQVTAVGLGEQPRILLIKGRLALAQKKIREGLISIDKAAEKYDRFSREKAETLLLSARARAQQGDWGAAAERYEQILAVNPKLPTVQLTLAGIYLRQRDLDAAQDHIDAVLTDDPTNERAKVIQASIQALRGDLDGAIKTYRELDLANRPDLAIGLGQLLIQGDRKDQAATLLQHYFDADPTNIRLLAVLLGAVDDMDRKTALIEQARQAGGNPQQLELLEQQLNPELAGDIDRTVEILTRNQEDPFLREITAARLYLQAGEGVKAREALARAAAIKPDDKMVVDMQFNFALQDQDLDLAQQLSDKAAQANLDEAGGRFYLAQLLGAKGDVAGTIRTLRAGLEEVPINSDGWRLLGDAYVQDGNDRDAIPAYERALQQKPDNLAAIRGLAAIRDRQGRHEDALEMLRLAVVQNPNHAQLMDLYLQYEGRYGDKQKALTLRRQLQETQPQNVDNLRALAMLLAETGKADEGEQIIRDVIAKQGQTPTNILSLANVQRLSGRSEQGGQTISRYIESLGTRATTVDYITLARYMLSIEDGQGAYQAYQKAISIESDQREATRELAALLFSRGNYERAVPMYRDLHSQFPDDQALALRLADGLVRIQAYDESAQVLAKVDPGPMKDALSALIAESKDNHDEALRLIERAIEGDPGKSIFYYERAVLNANTPDRIDQVIQDLNTSLSLNPNHLRSRRLLVGMYQRRGDHNEAIRELTNMVSRHPNDNESRLMLIRVYLQEGNMVGAKNLVQDALERKPDDPIWLTAQGDLALKENDTTAAIAAYQRVFEVNPAPAQLLKVTSLQIDNDRADDAQKLLRDNAAMVNSQPILQVMMGRALYASGQTDRARQVFTLAAERCNALTQLVGVAAQINKDYTLEQTTSLLEGLPATSNSTWVALALANLELSHGQAQQACDRLSALESSLPADAEAERQAVAEMMAPALHQAGHIQQALDYYLRIEKSSPDNASMLNNLAYLLADDFGKPEEALPRAQRAAELQPNNAQVLDTLGWIQFKLGQVDQARRTLQDSIDAGSVAANHLHMAELLLSQGYRTEAQRYLQTAIDLAEQNNEPKMLERAQELMKQINDLTEAS